MAGVLLAGLIAIIAAAAAPAAPASAGHLPRPRHVVVVVLENHAAGDVLGSPDAPWISKLAREGASFTRSSAIAHPSEPNYLALFSGSTQGVSDDACPNTFAAENLGHQLLRAGRTFAGYSEGLPRTGSQVCESGRYARKHAPWVNFSNLAARTGKSFTAFPRDLNRLPTVAFVIPDLCHDMHDCSVATGDRWLRARLGRFRRWAPRHKSLLLLTFDEDDGSNANRIATIVAGAGVRRGPVDRPIDHYGVLRTLEDFYGLGHAGRAAAAAPITGIWR